MMSNDNLSVEGLGGASEMFSSGDGIPSGLMESLGSASSADTDAAGNPAATTTEQGGGGTPAAATGTTAPPASDVIAPVAAAPAATPPGEAPEHRITAAVRNAREETRREVERQFEAFRGMDPERAALGMQLLMELQANPDRFLEDLSARVRGRSGEEDAFPEADLVSKDGTLKTYTDGTFQKILDIHGRRVTNQVMGQMRPIIEFVQRSQTREQTEAREAATRGAVSEAIATVSKLPHYNEAGILEALKDVPAAQLKAMGPAGATYFGYLQYLNAKVFPTLKADSEKAVRDEMTRKAAASVGVHPTQPGSTAKPELKNEDDVTRHMERMFAQAAT